MIEGEGCAFKHTGNAIIRRSDGRSFRIVPAQNKAPRPRFGNAKGLIEMGENFDEPLEDFKEYMS